MYSSLCKTCNTQPMSTIHLINQINPCKIRVKHHLQDSGPQWCTSYFSNSPMSLRSLKHVENMERRNLLPPTLHSCYPEKWHDPRKLHWVRHLFLVFRMLLTKVQRDNPCKKKNLNGSQTESSCCEPDFFWATVNARIQSQKTFNFQRVIQSNWPSKRYKMSSLDFSFFS